MNTLKRVLLTLRLALIAVLAFWASGKLATASTPNAEQSQTMTSTADEGDAESNTWFLVDDDQDEDEADDDDDDEEEDDK